jgi:integrase
MPLSLVPPNPKERRASYSVRGHYLGVYVRRSLKTGEKALAKRLLERIKRDIECGALTGKRPIDFAAAAMAYMQAGGERNFLYRIIKHFGVTPIAHIDQIAIDNCAAALYPHAAAATLNRQVYTPISAVLKHVGDDRKIRRPKGWRGRKLTHWLTPEQAFAVFKAALQIQAPAATRVRFRALLILLCYTGMRLGDGLGLLRMNINLDTQTALLPRTKNDQPRLVYLPLFVVTTLREIGVEGAGRLFTFHNGGRLRDMLKQALEIAGIALPRRVAFHVFCHTWATWMKQHGGLDTYDLLKTGRWADAESADRYSHVAVDEIAKRADALPVEKKAG